MKVRVGTAMSSSVIDNPSLFARRDTGRLRERVASWWAAMDTSTVIWVNMRSNGNASLQGISEESLGWNK